MSEERQILIILAQLICIGLAFGFLILLIAFALKRRKGPGTSRDKMYITPVSTQDAVEGEYKILDSVTNGLSDIQKYGNDSQLSIHVPRWAFGVAASPIDRENKILLKVFRAWEGSEEYVSIRKSDIEPLGWSVDFGDEWEGKPEKIIQVADVDETELSTIAKIMLGTMGVYGLGNSGKVYIELRIDLGK